MYLDKANFGFPTPCRSCADIRGTIRRHLCMYLRHLQPRRAVYWSAAHDSRVVTIVVTQDLAPFGEDIVNFQLQYGSTLSEELSIFGRHRLTSYNACGFQRYTAQSTGGIHTHDGPLCGFLCIRIIANRSKLLIANVTDCWRHVSSEVF